MHITFDGAYYFTVNGGKTENGRINKFNLSGELLESYRIRLDMRSIMYCEKNKSLYVNCYDGNLYRIVNLETGEFELLYEDLYVDEQASLALSPDGKYFYGFNKGDLRVFEFSTGKLKKTITALDCGEDFIGGNVAVAVDKKHIYTWNANEKKIHIYTLKGKLIKTVEISDGNYGPSISFANGYIFVSTDGNYNEGTWYAYDLWDVLDSNQ